MRELKHRQPTSYYDVMLGRHSTRKALTNVGYFYDLFSEFTCGCSTGTFDDVVMMFISIGESLFVALNA